MTPEVKEFMEQLGFNKPVSTQFGYFWSHPNGIDVIEEQVTFFYNQFRLRELKARIDENESIQEVAEHETSLPNHCELHDKYVGQCHACQKRKWFGITAKRLKEIVDERISDLNNQIAQLEGGESE